MTQSLIAVSAFVLSIGTLITPSVHAQALAENAPASKQLLQSDLKGVSGQEAMVFFVEFAPGQGLPWHVHPGGHELVYSLEGTFAFEEQNGTKSSLGPGEVKYIGPDIGHTVRNEGSTAAKVLVVRVKEKAKPIVTPFRH
jgi:quercetin dioxygenase-like cupin family protein